jgi:hypothetical protein
VRVIVDIVVPVITKVPVLTKVPVITKVLVAIRDRTVRTIQSGFLTGAS